MKTVKLIKLPEQGLMRFCTDGNDYMESHDLRSKYYFKDGYYYISIKEFFKIISDFTKVNDISEYGEKLTYRYMNKEYSRYVLHLMYVIKGFFPRFGTQPWKLKLNKKEAFALAKKFLLSKEEEYYQFPKDFLRNPYDICLEGQEAYKPFINGTDYSYATEEEIKNTMKGFLINHYGKYNKMINEKISMHLQYFIYSFIKFYRDNASIEMKCRIKDEIERNNSIEYLRKTATKKSFDYFVDSSFKVFKKYYKEI